MSDLLFFIMLATIVAESLFIIVISWIIYKIDKKYVCILRKKKGKVRE